MFEKELEVAMFAVNSVRDVILSIYNSGDIGVEIKSDNSPVTRADKAADKIIRDILSEAFPLYALLTEESQDDKARLNNDYVWIVDPVDGTKEFVLHNDEFAVNIGLSYKHVAVLGVILNPVTGEIYYGVKGQGSFYKKDKDAEPVKIHCSNKTTNLIAYASRNHSNAKEEAMLDKYKERIVSRRVLGASLKGCGIAKGDGDISFRLSNQTKEWDTCAMQVIVEEAGGALLKFDGEPIRYNREDVYNHGGYVICNKKENFLI